jgi:sigma-B regulation protein RsbU (phosphoserine phosphatase)
MPFPSEPGIFQERAELLDFLLEVSTAMAETFDLDRILSQLADYVKEVVPYDLFAVLLYTERAHGLRIRYSIGHREEIVKNLLVPLGEGITGTAAKTRAPVLVPDVSNDARYLNTVDAVRSEMAVPMVARGRLVGVLDVQSTQADAWNERHRSFLALLASRVAVSIDNARLYRRVERNNRTLRTLAHLSQEFSSILALDELLGRIAKTVHGLIEFDAFSIMLLDAERRLLRHRFSQRYDQRVNLDNIPLGKGITGAAAESRLPVRVADTLADPRYIASHPDIRSEMAIPLIVQDRVVGVMDMESERMGFFTEDHARLMMLLAPQIASSVENARLYEELGQREKRMEDDLKAARKLQSVLLPKEAPEIRGLEMALNLRPAREISGDIYDFFEHGDEYAVIAFGDVSGKGAAAALYGALVSGLLRSLAPRRRGPASLMRALNEVLLERKIDAQYVTLTLLLWSSRDRRFVMANAGAVPPMICRDGEILKLRVEGVPLGLLDEREYDEVTFDAKPGDIILLYSDGIQDQTNDQEEEYGRTRLARVLKSSCNRTPAEIVAAVAKDLAAFRGSAPDFDDQTLIAIRVV